MRRLAAILPLALAGCAAGPANPAALRIPRPDVPTVVALEPGIRIRTELTDGTPDEPIFRAAAVWWREALRQSVTFDIGDQPGPDGQATLVLAIDTAGQRLSAFVRHAGTVRALAGDAFLDGNLIGAIDRLAWASRLAIGEDAPPPVSVAACVSTNVRAILSVVDGFLLLHDGGIESARRAFLAARRDDGASPFVLDGLASVALMRGQPIEAERLCREALGYEARLSPTSRHRLARTMLLARASQAPMQAPERDRELLALGEVYRRERPYDPEGRLTVGIANNFLGSFAEARATLAGLKTRLPRQAVVSYHLGWACLATDDPTAAVAWFDDAAVRLPMAWVAIPRALAHYAAAEHAELARLLTQLADDARPRGGEPVHELQRMQAAHALLRGDYEQAGENILTDLNWLLANPTMLAKRPGQFAEQGEVLVRLGRADALPPLIAAVQAQLPTTAVADACAYLSGLVQIRAHRARSHELEGRLSRGGDSVFALRLQAFAHEVRGELADMHAALARAARMSDSPLTKALLARSLKNMGRHAEAKALQDAIRRELVSIDLRRRPSHPLLGPELAFAFLME